MPKRVAVIGGGCSGLAAIKCCLDEGLQPVCFERTDQVGGLWRYTEQVRKGQGCVMRSTVINSSKEMMCFSDYPVPKHYPNFMHNRQVWQYFKDYAEHFRLYDHIQYNTEVILVKRARDFGDTGRWDLTIVDHKSGEERTETFDAVLVCTGHHAEKNEPSFPGLSDFQGRVVHSHDYREPSSYVGKRILIIGIGNSAVDLAVELSRCAQVFLSTRRGTWVFKRLSENGGLPFDLEICTRLRTLMDSLLPKKIVQNRLKKQLNRQLDHDLYGLTPAYPPLTLHTTVNDDLGTRIANGTVKMKADVSKFTATGVEFKDGTVEENIDVVMLATGYIFGFPFIEKAVVDVKENRLPFYKYTFPPDLQHNTLAVIGCIQPLGSVAPISEMQCRLATRVFKGDVKLPPASAMWDDIRAKETEMDRRYYKSLRHTIQVDCVPFMDELAELIGCKPDMLSLLKSDPVLAWHVFTGPCTPIQYRLTGPGKWSVARNAIHTTMDRVRFPLATRPLPKVKDSEGTETLLILLLLFVAGVIVVRVYSALG